MSTPPSARIPGACARITGTLAAMALAGLAACQGVSEETSPNAGEAPAVSEGSPKVAPATATLRIDVPFGVKVELGERGELDGPVAEVSGLKPGVYTVRFVPPCAEASAVEVTLKAGDDRLVEPSTAIPFAEIAVSVTTPDGPPEELRIELFGQELVGGASARVAACPDTPARLHVEAKGWGGYWEDLVLEAGKSYAREVALAHGPDLVRIPGGRFTLGPPKRLVGVWFDWIPRVPVELKTYDIDRTEVTAAQLHECHTSGGCPHDRMQWGITEKAHPDLRPNCTSDVFDRERTPKKDRADHPANCVAAWEAEQYCAWAGKRLPTAAEWEYAARSRNEDYACPWGREEESASECAPPREAVRGQKTGTVSVDAVTSQDSEQGVRDLMWNVEEYVRTAEGFGVRGRRIGALGARAAFEYSTYHHPKEPRQDVLVGFRCVRDVGEASPRP